MGGLASTDAPVLERIATELNRQHQLCRQSYGDALGHARRVGELLNEAKAKLAHGQWLAWLAGHTSVSERNAQRYMQLAEASTDAVAHLGIADALKALATPRQVSEPTAPEPRAAPPDIGEQLRRGGLDTSRARAELDRKDEETDRFPSPGVERKAVRDIQGALEAVGRHLRQGSQPGLIGPARAESFQNAAGAARDVAELFDGLADALR